MSLNSLKQHALNHKNNLVLPDWVSPSNSTLIIFKAINKLKESKLQFISIHTRAKDYKKKSNYQIQVSEVSRKTQMANTTITHTSKYSPDVRRYLDDINDLLIAEKNRKLDRIKKTRQAGTQQKRKDEIKKELQKTRKELCEAKERNATEQAQHVLSTLPLPIKRQLGLNM